MYTFECEIQLQSFPEKNYFTTSTKYKLEGKGGRGGLERKVKREAEWLGASYSLSLLTHQYPCSAIIIFDHHVGSLHSLKIH